MKMALQKKQYPAHDMRPKIIELLNETKREKNLRISDIAKACGVSPDYVRKVNEQDVR